MTPAYAFIDCETTGFAAMRHCVITLTCFVTDASYNILGDIDLKFRPDGSKEVCWTDKAQEVHGISWEEAITFPPIADSLEELKAFLDGFGPLPFIAHNVAFDKRMVRDLFNKTLHISSVFDGYFPEFQDTVKLLKESGLITGDSKNLGEVCRQLGIEHNHHDARSDAFVLIEIHRRCKEAHNKDSILTASNSDTSTTPEVFV